jgi:hypothetical protein
MTTKRAFLFLLFVVIIAVSIFAFFWFKPKITPISRLEAEQEIYSILLADKSIGGEKINPILEHTTLGEFQESTSEKSVKFIMDGLPVLKRETLVDFQENNKASYPIKDFLPLTNNDPLIHPNDNQQIWWVSFSRIGLNSSLDQALVIAELYAACKNGFCEYGTGNFILLHKESGRWYIQEQLEIWHMHPT